MKKIILTIILSSFISVIAVADDHVMRNDNPNASASVMTGKHMMNKNINASASVMTGKHMMNSNPNSSSSNTGTAKTNKKTEKRYTIIKYKK